MDIVLDFQGVKDNICNQLGVKKLDIASTDRSFL